MDPARARWIQRGSSAGARWIQRGRKTGNHCGVRLVALILLWGEYPESKLLDIGENQGWLPRGNRLETAREPSLSLGVKASFAALGAVRP
jgi:hypothetical protein